MTRSGLGKIDLVKRLLIVAQDGTESEVSTDATLACGQQYVYEIEVTNALPEDAKASSVQTMVRDDMGSVIDDGRIGFPVRCNHIQPSIPRSWCGARIADPVNLDLPLGLCTIAVPSPYSM